MTWNNQISILGTVEAAQNEAEATNAIKATIAEADVIFTALFLGSAVFRNVTKQDSWRVDMEADISAKTAAEREANDRASMMLLNTVCSKVNHVLGWSDDGQEPPVTWGLTPTFDRGGMILGAQHFDSVDDYDFNPAYAKFAFEYLTASHRSARDGNREGHMYIGRGAYCGLVIDNDGNAVTAMSTVRSTLSGNSEGAGKRWKPPLGAPIRAHQYPSEPGKATWGIIGGTKIQEASHEQGMQFFPQAHGQPIPLDVDDNVVGYTHGMARSMYETERIGQGTAFEMSIGTATYKLASCVPCSTFMFANGVFASSTHLGRGESWSPIFNGDSNNPSPYDGEKSIADAVKNRNDKFANFVYYSMLGGVQKLNDQIKWLAPGHRAAFDALYTLLNSDKANEHNTVARDLFLDSLTVHKSDLERLDNTLTIPPEDAQRLAALDWYRGPAEGVKWRTAWKTPYTDEVIEQLHRPPASPTVTYRLTATSSDGSPCDFAFSITGPDGSLKYEGKLKQAGVQRSNWFFEFDVARSINLQTWKIKIAGQAMDIALDKRIAVDETHEFVINPLTD